MRLGKVRLGKVSLEQVRYNTATVPCEVTALPDITNILPRKQNDEEHGHCRRTVMFISWSFLYFGQKSNRGSHNTAATEEQLGGYLLGLIS